MYKGIYHIRNSLWGVATWMSEILELEHKKQHQVTRNDKFIFILLKKMNFSSSTKVTPTTGVVEQ